jgi:predicted dehydrogenase
MTDTRQPAIEKCTSIELKAIYSRSLKSAHKLAEGIPGILLASDDGNENEKNDLASVIVSDEIDAVIIA